jgi:hypothetical protein
VLDDNALSGDNDELKNEDVSDRSIANSIDNILEEYRPKSVAQLSTNHAHLLRCAAFVHNTGLSHSQLLYHTINLLTLCIYLFEQNKLVRPACTIPFDSTRLQCRQCIRHCRRRRRLDTRQVLILSVCLGFSSG